MSCEVDLSCVIEDQEERKRLIQEVSRISCNAEKRKWIKEQKEKGKDIGFCSEINTE